MKVIGAGERLADGARRQGVVDPTGVGKTSLLRTLDPALKHHGAADFANVAGTPPWHEIALSGQRRSSRLRAKEQEFVNDMASRTVWREPTKKQGKWLKSIFYRLGGKRP